MNYDTAVTKQTCTASRNEAVFEELFECVVPKRNSMIPESCQICILLTKEWRLQLSRALLLRYLMDLSRVCDALKEK
ncbi:hypothetical protein Y032_0575g189 [Ancylostoma ceylanicum]|uniref:Uncharacterized protein n=1 Tax=Ancylostoma ceylanicum TaxID=53326 RepID=A0A016WNL2_9BILA|nr:hypothetical protein Y032_0575g189 [Ancylostoma ceylanicum]